VHVQEKPVRDIAHVQEKRDEDIPQIREIRENTTKEIPIEDKKDISKST